MNNYYKNKNKMKNLKITKKKMRKKNNQILKD